MTTDIEKLLDPDYAGNPNSHQEAVETIHANYLAVRQAIMDLATGKAVVKITISGKVTEFIQTDLPQLRTLRDELANELRSLLDISKGKCYKIKTKGGF